ncbi:MAG: ABC transporter permease subunit [Eubacterium sp.]|nr:ABC transporter permease subunit [Eubacterium sp.]
MIMIRQELRQGRTALAVWTAAIGFLLAVCIFMYPEMKQEMDGINDIFSSMGSFTEAFGMDRVSFGTLSGFYAVECGNILGLGGAFFASLCAVTVLAKEEKEHTAEFLLTHPVRRSRIVADKLAAVLLEVIILNAVVYGIAAGSVLLIGETVPWKEISLLHLAYFLLQIELAGICFGISAFLKRSGIGIGIGIAVMMYFLNLIANISERAEFLKYITPFGYTEGADLVTDLALDAKLVLLGMAFAAAGVTAGFVKYCKKDIC